MHWHSRPKPSEDPTVSDETQNPLRDAIEDAIESNPVILFMKGTPEQPMCGFSARTAGALQTLETPFAAVDVLPDPRIRQELSALSNWPTIPQLFVRGELVGGADIVAEMYESGELAELLGVEQPEDADAAGSDSQAQPAPLSIENRLS
jgi:monothiol glutaredoxin